MSVDIHKELQFRSMWIDLTLRANSLPFVSYSCAEFPILITVADTFLYSQELVFCIALLLRNLAAENESCVPILHYRCRCRFLFQGNLVCVTVTVFVTSKYSGIEYVMIAVGMVKHVHIWSMWVVTSVKFMMRMVNFRKEKGT